MMCFYKTKAYICVEKYDFYMITLNVFYIGTPQIFTNTFYASRGSCAKS